MRERIRSTTILCVRRDGKVVMAGDGQVTLGSEVLKASAKKLRRLYNGKILAGFAGSTADAFALFARFETKLEQYNGNLARSRGGTGEGLAHGPHAAASGSAAAGGRYRTNTYIVSGNGDVIEPDDDIAAIGSGGPLRESGGHGADGKYETFARARSSKRPWPSRARSASTRTMNVLSMRSWADGDLSSRPSRRRRAAAG